MIRMFAVLFFGVAAFGGYNFMYVNAVTSMKSQNAVRYEQAKLSPAERRAKRREKKRKEAKLEKTALARYEFLDKEEAVKRIRTGCKFLVRGWTNRYDSKDHCGCIAKRMKGQMTAKQINFIYVSAKQTGLRALAGRNTSPERLRITYKMSENAVRAVAKKAGKIIARCTK